MNIDVSRPKVLYRYSGRRWLERSLTLGEFRLRPASHYRQLEAARARRDDEQHRTLVLPATSVTITHVRTGLPIKPLSDVTFETHISTDYLTLCLSRTWGEHLFSDFEGSDSCLVINKPDEFCNRIHAAAGHALPDWNGLDAPVRYGARSPLGAAFTKANEFMFQFEWRFAWLPPTPTNTCQPIIISIGSIESIAAIVARPIAKDLSDTALSVAGVGPGHST